METDPSNRIETSGAHPAAFDFLSIKACRPPYLRLPLHFIIVLRSEDFVSIHEHGRVNSLSDSQLFNERTPTPFLQRSRFPNAGKNYHCNEKLFQAKKRHSFFLCKGLKAAEEQKVFWKKTSTEQLANPSKADGKLEKDFARREN